MSRLLLTAAVLAVLVYTMVLGVRWLSPRIEQDIAGRVTTGLAEQGLLWADVSVEGRDVVLSGTAPDADAKTRAMNVATRVFGVSKVQDNLVVAGDVSSTTAMVSGTAVSVTTPVVAAKPSAKSKKPLVDYTLTITKDGEKIALEGNVPDEVSKEVLVTLATNRYNAGNVDASKLTIVEGAPAGWRSAVGAVLMHISNMEQATAIISNTEVMVSGNVLDKQYSDKMEQDVSQVLPKTYKVAFAVDVVTPTVVEPAAGEVSATDTATAAPASPTNVAATGKTAPVTCDGQADLKKQTLMFGFDKADLSSTHKAKLDVVAKRMKACAEERVVLAGFTDVTGSKLYNKWLSQQRAEAAMRGLMRDGVAKERLKAVGYGEQYPVAPNTTKANRAQNRRVEFHEGSELPYAVSASEAVVAPVKVSQPAKVVSLTEGKSDAVKPVAKDEAKADNKPKLVKHTVSISKTTVVTVSGTDVSSSEPIAKPWWARKVVSDTAVEVR